MSDDGEADVALQEALEASFRLLLCIVNWFHTLKGRTDGVQCHSPSFWRM